MLEMVAFVCVLIFSAVFLYCRFKRRCRKKRCNAAVLIPVLPDDELFERRVRACYWDETFAGELDGKDILLLTNEPCANAYAAKRLEQELSCVHTVHITSLKDYIIRNYY